MTQIPTVVGAESIGDLFDVLLGGAADWAGAGYGDLAFRGQACSRWALVPKALRPGTALGYRDGGTKPQGRRVIPQSRAEFGAVREFVRAADRIGLAAGSAARVFLSQDEPRHTFADNDWEYSWPQESVFETLALAQHHGVPTRLLDFTHDPLVACYFAAEDVWMDTHKKQVQLEPENGHLAIWVIDLRFTRSISRVDHRYPERVAEVRLPRSSNPNLHAQSAFFLVDRGANDVMAYTSEPAIDRAITDRSNFWNHGDNMKRKGIQKVWFDDVPIRKVTLKRELAVELLVELEKRGVNRAALMPTYDHVVKSLELTRCIAGDEEGGAG